MASLEDLTTDQLLAKARELEQSQGLFNSLITNPETRETIQRAMKKLNPKLSIPEIDATDKITTLLDAERAERKKLENSILEDRVRARLEKNRADIKAKYNLTDKDVEGVEALMVESKENPDPLPSYDTAARVFIASRKSAEPTPANYSPPVFDMPDASIWGKGIGNPARLNKIAMTEAGRAMQEILTGKVAGNS